MPSDITGTNVFNMQSSEFSLRPGPIFTDILLADEINRAPAKAHIFTDKEGMPLFDFKKVAKKLKKQKLAFMEVRVLLGKSEFVPCRLIVSQVDTKTYEKRLRKAQKHARSKNINVSNEHKERIGMNIFITNAPKERISAEQVQDVYSLRWQIKLMFKVWKSQNTGVKRLLIE